MPKNDAESQMSEESIDFLNDVKKGKPRRFVLICKGANIVSLVVYKKGSVEKFKKEAKEVGSGTVSFGVVDGKGNDIKFKVARADGFETEPTSPAKLKEFIKSAAEITCAPDVLVVDTHEAVLDIDDPLVAKFLKLREVAKQAAIDHSDQASEINSLCQEISQILDKDPSSDEAHGKIGGLEKLLSKLAFGGGSESVPTTKSQDEPVKATPTAPPRDNPQLSKFKVQLATLLKQATPYLASIGDAVKELASQAREAAEGKDDFATANDKLKEIVALIKKGKETPGSEEARDQMVKFNEQLLNLKNGLDRLKSGDGEAKLKASEVGALVRQAGGFAQKGDFDEAFQLLDQASATTESAERDLSVRELKLKDARESLHSAKVIAGKLRSNVTSDLGTLPSSLETRFDEVDKSLELDKETDPDKLEKAADDSGDLLHAIELDAQKLLGEKLAYLSELRLIEGRLKALQSHSQKTVEFVKGKIEAVELEVNAAKSLADEHKYVEAAQKLFAIAEQSAQAEAIADQHAQYTGLLADRQQRVDALTDSTNVDAQKPVTAVREKLAKAKEHVTSPKFEFGKAVELLNQIPQDCIDAAWIVKKASEYDAALLEKTDEIKNAKTWGSVEEMTPYMPPVEKILDDAKYEKTKDVVKSVSMLQRVSAKLGELWKIITTFREFRDEYKKAKTSRATLNSHPGKAGVTEQIARIDNDLLFAEAKRDAHEYVVAKNVCLHIQEFATEATKVAVLHKDYLARRKQVTDKRDTFTGGKSSWVADLLGEADTLVNSAATFVSAKDYVAAMKELDAAFSRCESAQTVLNNQKTVDGWKNNAEPLINDLATDFESAYNEFVAIKNKVSNYDTESSFTSQLSTAEGKANQARTAATKTSPDISQAQQLLRDAIQDCNNVVFWVDQFKSYKKLREPIANRVSVLKNVGRENVIDDEIKAVEDKLTEAKNEADARRYAQAEALLTQAQTLLVDADKKAKLYDDYTALRAPHVNNAIAAVDTVQGRAAMDVEVAKLKSDLIAANSDRTNKKLQEALDALKKIKSTADAMKVKLDDYIKAKAAEKKWITDKIGDIQGKPVVADDLLKIEVQRTELQTMYENRQFKEALNMAGNTIRWQIHYAKQVVDRYQAYVVERDNSTDAIDKLKEVACDAIKDDIKTAENFFSKAETFASQRNYENAKPLLSKALEWCPKPTALGKAFKLYAPALNTAREAVTLLKQDFATNDAVDLQVTELQRKLESAESLAKKKLFDDAKKLVDEVTNAAAEVRKTAEAQGEFDSLAKTTAEGPRGSVEGLEVEIEKIKVLAGKLESRGIAPLGDQLARIARLLETAEKERQGNNAAKARLALTDAAKQCAYANSVADQYAQVVQSIKSATSKVDSVRQKYAEPALVQLTTDRLDKEIALAQFDVDNGLYSSALNALQSVGSDIEDMEAIGVQHASYAAERKKIDPRLETLAKGKARYVIAKELGEARAFVAESEDLVDARDYREAMKMLVAATDIADRLSLQADMHEEKEPTKDELQAILKKPDGEKQLDAVIKTLDPKAQRKVCKLALELRFDTELQLFTDKDGNFLDTDLDKNAPDILRFYNIMQALPKSHTRENPSMAFVKKMGEDVGTSSFSKGSRKLELRIGRATDKTERMIGQEWEMGEVDEDTKPSDAAPPTKFNWTTLHEIGHAVDDKVGFMKRNGSQSDYGGWKEYGANVSEIAKVAAKHFKFNEAYVEAYLAGEKPPHPELEGTVTAEEWDRQRIEAETWCDSIRNDKSIYYSASATNRLQIDGRVYQEAYANKWVSYDFAARKKGVAGYQFRAPGEWFAEIYAAYHTGKMNANHPARKWLSQL